MNYAVRMDDEEYWARLRTVSKAFRPASPIDDVALFAGRTKQMVKVIDTAEQPGQHGVIYGGRGVGKTSLAKYMAATMRRGGTPSFHYTCGTTSTFDSIWHELLADIELAAETL